MPWHSKCFDIKIAFGSFTHELLQFFEARNTFIYKHSRGIFHRNIQSRSNQIRREVSQVCAAADADVPIDFSRTIDLATILTKRSVDKLFSMPNWEPFRTEYSLPANLMTKIKDEELRLSGRLDFITSNGIPRDANHFDADTVIINFKAGNNVEMTERNVKWHMGRCSRLQLFLSGIALKLLGCKIVKLLILKLDSKVANTSLTLII
jgi:hypothetical protein